VGSILTQKTDPTAHPEMEAIKQAARIKDSRYLEGCYLFSTLEPCPMCCAAAVWAKMAGVVFGASQQDALAWTAAHPGIKHSWWQIEIPAHLIAQAGDPALAIWEGVLRAQYQELFNLSEKASPERR
jgi:tRNA(Arg) A34 adenosine deaminase TadA